MPESVFVANRGEVALRIVRAARELGLDVVVAVTRAEVDSLAARLATAVHVLPGDPPVAAGAGKRGGVNAVL